MIWIGINIIILVGTFYLASITFDKRENYYRTKWTRDMKEMLRYRDVLGDYCNEKSLIKLKYKFWLTKAFILFLILKQRFQNFLTLQNKNKLKESEHANSHSISFVLILSHKLSIIPFTFILDFLFLLFLLSIKSQQVFVSSIPSPITYLHHHWFIQRTLLSSHSPVAAGPSASICLASSSWPYPVHRRGISPPSYFIVTFHLLYYSIHFSIDVFSFYFPLPPPFVLMMVISQPPPSTIHRPCQCREAMFADFRVFNGGVDKKKRTFILSPADLWQSYDIRSVGTFVVGESMAEGIMLLSLLLLYRAG